MTSVTLHAVGSTYTRAAKPNMTPTHAARDRMRISGTGAAGTARIYLRYRVEIPEGQQIASARHRLVAEDPRPASRAVRAYRVETVGTFADVSWNNGLDVLAGPESVSHTGRWFHDVTDLMPTTSGAVVLMFDTLANDDWWMRGRRDSRGVPTLVVEFEPRPVQPTDVKPIGTIGIAAPHFTWHGQVDVDTVQMQAAVEDEPWDASTGFTTPTFTSAEIASVENALDSAAAGWTGLADTESADVTFRERTPRGWGDWSEPIAINRKNKPVITFTNPGATTADATPPVTWTAPGQTAWQMLIDNSDEGRVANSGKRVGLDGGTYQQPDTGGDPGESFTYTVRAWDDEDRSESPGDPTYSEAVLTSVYTPTDQVAPMAGLTAMQVPGLPKVILTATRAELPDAVRFIRDRSEVAVLDAAVDGLTFGDWTCPPNQPVTYKARAVVNNEDADVDATLQIRTAVKGVWVVDPLTERGFVLSGKDGLSVSLGSNVVVHTPVAGAHLIRRTMALRGVEGTITGQIADGWPGRTLREQYEDALWLRERPERPVQLVMGDLSVRVATSNLQPLFDPQISRVDNIRHNVTFDFSAAPEG